MIQVFKTPSQSIAFNNTIVSINSLNNVGISLCLKDFILRRGGGWCVIIGCGGGCWYLGIRIGTGTALGSVK